MSGAGAAELENPVSVSLLTPAEQEALIVELTSYANYQIQTRARWIPRGVLPSGHDAASLALEAISRVLDGRRRDWDPLEEPSPTAYLKSVVKSIFSSEIVPAARRQAVEVPPVGRDGADRLSTAPSSAPGADAVLELEELKEHILSTFEDDEDQLVLLCLFDGVSEPAAIATETGLEPPDIYRIKRKIRRRLVHLREAE